MKHPKDMTVSQRIAAGLMTDAMRKLETELHWSLIDMGGIPPEWNEIWERLPESHPKRVKVTADFDADVVKFFKGLGRGYQARMNAVLRAYMKGRMAKIINGPDTTDWILHPERIPERPEFVE